MPFWLSAGDIMALRASQFKSRISLLAAKEFITAMLKLGRKLMSQKQHFQCFDKYYEHKPIQDAQN